MVNGMTITIDKLGRVVLPRDVRSHFGLQGGASLTLEILPTGIRLAPTVEQPRLVKEDDGIYVHGGKPTGNLEKAVEETRTLRDATFWRA